ncbi:MAG: D-aminoacyl-tRNA deacylase [Candidatus Pacearchaeota archaeon]|jgi:D-aminoacyl-tRNA deacylase
MRFAIAYSKLNSAGTNIVEQFRGLAYAPQIPIIELPKDTIFSEDISEKKYPELRNIDFLIFASTHKSEKGNPSLSLHAPGNWRNADLGGKPGKVCKTSSYVLKYLFQELNKNYQENKDKLSEEYSITLEVTHHGPLTQMPCCFIELGSSPKQWDDKDAAKIVARTILSLQNYDSNFIASHQWIPTIGIGGPHYAPNFNKIQLNSNYAVSHIIPEYCLPIGENMLTEAEQKTLEQVKEVLIDWKGCGNSESRQSIINTLEKYGLKYKRTDKVEK